MAAIFFIKVLDHFLAPLVLEIHVDIRGLVALLADEAFEQQGAAIRIHLSHMEAVAHRRIGR